MMIKVQRVLRMTPTTRMRMNMRIGITMIEVMMLISRVMIGNITMVVVV